MKKDWNNDNVSLFVIQGDRDPVYVECLTRFDITWQGNPFDECEAEAVIAALFEYGGRVLGSIRHGDKLILNVVECGPRDYYDLGDELLRLEEVWVDHKDVERLVACNPHEVIMPEVKLYCRGIMRWHDDT